MKCVEICPDMIFNPSYLQIRDGSVQKFTISTNKKSLDVKNHFFRGYIFRIWK